VSTKENKNKTAYGKKLGLIIWAQGKNSLFLESNTWPYFWLRINSAKQNLQGDSINSQNVRTVLDIRYQDDRSSGYGLKI